MNDIPQKKNSGATMWDDRYRRDEYVYGVAPNVYLAEQLPKLAPGTILFPAEGEGRNAVYAAKLGWTVSAFDISQEGKNKAMRLAAQHNVPLDYTVGGLDAVSYTAEQFDAIALIYAHFPADMRRHYHRALDGYLKVGGTLILEGFSKKHVDYQATNAKVGGPRDVEMLFSMDQIKADFPNYEVIELQETEVELNEGLFHNGKGSVIRFVGRKKHGQRA